MSFLTRLHKGQLRFVAEELSEDVTSSDLKIPDLRKLILNSKNYDEEMVRGMFDILIEEAEQNRQARREEAERQAKREEAERQAKREEAERQAKREEVERKHALELKKLEIAAKTSDFVDSDLLPSAPKVDWQSQLRKFCTSSEDIGLYLPKRPKFCTACKKEGQGTKECTNKIPSPSVNAISAVSHVNNTTKNISIEGENTSALMDTAADISMLKYSFAQRLNKNITRKVTVPIRGIGGVKESLGIIIVNVITDKVKLREVLFYVVNDDTFEGPDVLKGNDIIDSPHVVIVRNQGRSKLVNIDELSVLRDFQVDEMPDRAVLRTLKEFVIEPRTVQWVTVFNEGKKSDGYVSYSTQDNMSNGITLAVYEGKTNELGCINNTTMHITEIPGSKPVSRSPYRASNYERQVLREIVQELKGQGVIRDSCSEYSSPVLLVSKKTGDKRMVIDYRHLNSQTIKDKFPLPCIDDLLERLSGFSLFCILDACQGFSQIPMDEESSRKAAFTTPDGHYEPTRLFFGFSNGPPVFQRAMSLALGDLLWSGVSCFVDDIFFGSTDFDDMIAKLRQVLEKLLNAGVTLKLSKCEFGMSEIEYLGFVIDKNGIRPGPRKLAAIAEYPVPKSKDELRRFLGLTSFFRRFITRYTSVAEPLTRLLKKNSLFIWTVDQKEAFEELRSKLISRPALKLFDPKDETELHTDASSVGLAGMLLQRNKYNNAFQLVYCVSRRTTQEEEKYHSSRLELIAAVWSMTRLRPLLLDGILYRIHHESGDLQNMRKLFVMPKSMRKYLAVRFHDFAGHFGMEKVVQMIRKQFWFPLMTSYIKQHIRQCVVCAYSKVPGGKSQGKLNAISPGSRPFEVIHMDFLGPFVTSTSRNKELLVFIDNMTKFVRLRPCPSCSTKNVLKYLDEFTNDFGCPRRIVTDRGSCFSSSLFEDYCKQFGIKHKLNSSQRPVQTDSHKDWDKILPEVQRCINWSLSKSIGKPPFELLYGYTPVKLGYFPHEYYQRPTNYKEVPKKILGFHKKR
ncbi:Retrovirus-related Pol polyprotein like [Argiope bruennichi]|uniref:RNA-directed DNA polymerase n=1 Tax=Argiope bruennichi TaxID=94029 RepID=A0A8T0EQL3_ARGBR|nr:Retrovirus-related Pol polyprotein like [Argiope bruennichi]